MGSGLSQALGTSAAGWEIGIHYNYDTFHQPGRFASQKAEIEALIGKAVTAGRAHYLHFDPRKSPAFMAEREIRFDESIGSSSQNGYKAGIAEPFRPLNEAVGRRVEVIELPLVFMDTNLVERRGRLSKFQDSLQAFGEKSAASLACCSTLERSPIPNGQIWKVST